MVVQLSTDNNVVRNLRIESGMSQSKFAEYFDIPVRTLQDWEQGRRTPPDYVVKMMLRIWKEKLE